jgi:capsule polysaccharide export protein KpsE/RkpR
LGASGAASVPASRSQDDIFIPHAIALSRDALTELNQQLGIRNAYASCDVDFINRFRLDWDDSLKLYTAIHFRIEIDYE